ncbi:MAG: RagB/SusD family nutrient uptake outer membrane protein [Bacteroidales bacterium]|nr:RagB/SusD family nutrient uptake outer membrane protein [Bacteroidales bacterium]
MKFKLIILSSVLILISSCQGFLDKTPMSLSPENYYTIETNVTSFPLSLYSLFASHGLYEWGTFQLDVNTDNMAYVTPDNRFAPGYWKVPEVEGGWNSWGAIYQINSFLALVPGLYEAGKISGSESSIRQAIGEVYFFRALDYFNKLQVFGDLPIIDKVLDNDLEKLTAASRRSPRNEVSRFILSNLDKALEYLSESPNGGKNRINTDCAHMLKSRVALYEGTFLKYFKGTPFVPCDDAWPGKTKEFTASYSYPEGSIDAEYNWFLDVAMKESAIIAEKYSLTPNTCLLQQSLSEPANPYFDMFGATNMSDYPEIILWRAYNVDQFITNSVNQWTSDSNCGYGTTKSMVEAFVMKNGLPIYATGSGYPGDSNLLTITKDRDSRAQLFIKKPGDRNLFGTPTGPGQEIESWPRITDGAQSNRYTTGYTIRKGLNFDPAQNIQQQCSIGSIVFRASEAYLNYIEACYERTGTIDASADKYWRAIRKRAGIEEDYNVTIAATNMVKEGESDWGAWSGGTLVNATLFNIRRERRCEFMAENFRNSDLVRWRSMDQMITTPYTILGINLWEASDRSKFGAIYGGVNVSPESFSKYLAPYHILSNNRVYNGYRWHMAHYLSPIAIQHFLITGGGDVEASTLYQNPYWPRKAYEGPVDM